VDLWVGQIPAAALRILPNVRKADADLDFAEAGAFSAPSVAYDLQITHADGKHHVHRILADDRHQHAAGRVYEIAERVGGAADAAVDRRPDISVAKVHLC